MITARLMLGGCRPGAKRIGADMSSTPVNNMISVSVSVRLYALLGPRRHMWFEGLTSICSLYIALMVIIEYIRMWCGDKYHFSG